MDNWLPALLSDYVLKNEKIKKRPEPKPRAQKKTRPVIAALLG